MPLLMAYANLLDPPKYPQCALYKAHPRVLKYCLRRYPRLEATFESPPSPLKTPITDPERAQLLAKKIHHHRPPT